MVGAIAKIDPLYSPQRCSYFGIFYETHSNNWNLVNTGRVRWVKIGYRQFFQQFLILQHHHLEHFLKFEQLFQQLQQFFVRLRNYRRNAADQQQQRLVCWRRRK